MKISVLTYVIVFTITTNIICFENRAAIGTWGKLSRRTSSVKHTEVNHDLLSLSNFEELARVRIGDTITTPDVTSSYLESSLQFFVKGNNLVKLASTHDRPENIYLVTAPGPLLITAVYHRYVLNKNDEATIKQRVQKYTLEVTE